MGDCKGLVIVTAPVAVLTPSAQLQRRLAHISAYRRGLAEPSQSSTIEEEADLLRFIPCVAARVDSRRQGNCPGGSGCEMRSRNQKTVSPP